MVAEETLVGVTVLETTGQTALVEYELDGVPYRSYVDVADVVKDETGDVCPLERLQDAPYGIVWEFDFSNLSKEVETALKKKGIWTYSDLQNKDRATIPIATNLLGRAIWEAAKHGCNRR